jgi:hypothetical protein
MPGKMQAVTWTQSALAEQGFSGFVRFSDLPTAGVPTDPGVYVVVRPATTDPVFLPSSAAGWLKGKDPSVPIAVLENAWVEEASVMYIGKANLGSTGDRGLRKRLEEYRSHGTGKRTPHGGGRYIWQLADRDDLLVGWRPTADADARSLERQMIVEFEKAYQKRPFANLVG